jgi:predicted transport protein
LAVTLSYFNIAFQILVLHKKLLYIICLLFSIASTAQPKKLSYITISGTVYDVTARNPIEAVTVISSHGNGTITDSFGRYFITVRQSDSIWFSMLGKSTNKFPVDTIKNTEAFDVMLHVRVADLPEVRIRSKNYRLDSLENRREYAKIFNFKKPTISLLNNRNYTPGAVTVGLDLQEFINMFRFKHNRSIAALQKRLLQQEQDKYIDYRFNKNFVRKLTKLQQPELDSFMNKYRPDYNFLLTLNDIEFGYFIQRDFEEYKSKRALQKGSFRKQNQ